MEKIISRISVDDKTYQHGMNETSKCQDYDLINEWYYDDKFNKCTK